MNCDHASTDVMRRAPSQARLNASDYVTSLNSASASADPDFPCGEVDLHTFAPGIATCETWNSESALLTTLD